MFGTREIRDQEYNEKASTVTITVVCCDPEKIRDKLCCKGAKVIKSIEIKEPPPPVKPIPPEKFEKPEKPNGPKPPEKLRDPPPPPPARPCCGSCSGGCGGQPCRCYCGFAPPFGCPCGCGYYGRPCHVARCDFYFCEENPQTCSIM